MTDLTISDQGAARLQSVSWVPSVPDALTGLDTLSGQIAATGLEARPALLTLVTTGGAPVCEGDSCFVPGAEGAWAEVPD